MIDERQPEPLSRRESLRLLAGVSFGRVVFTQRALPAIRLVSHLIADGNIIIMASLGPAMTAGSDAMVLAYEADLIDPHTRLGWSVAVIGAARLVTDADLAAGYRAMLRPWVGTGTDDVIAIQADLVTGYQLSAAPAPRATAG